MFLIALGAFALVFVELLPVGMLPQLSEGLGVSEGTAGLVVTVTAWVAAISAPLIPLVVGRLDRRWVLAGLTFLLIASSIITYFATSFAIVIVARAILGIGAGGFWAAGILAATALMPEKPHTASSLVFGGIALATVLSTPVGSFLSSFLDWHVVYLLGVVLGVVIFILQLVMLPTIPAEKAVRLRDFGGVLRSPALVTILVVVVLLVVGNFAGFTFIAPFLAQVTGVGPGLLSILLLVYGAITFVGNFAGGHFAGKSARGTVIATAALFVAGLLLLVLFGQSVPIVVVALVLWALAWSATPVGTQLLLFASAGEGHSVDAAQALNTSVFQASIGLGALLGGIAFNASGVQSAMVLGLGVLVLALVVSIVLVIGLRRTEAAVHSAAIGTGTETGSRETSPAANQA